MEEIKMEETANKDAGNKNGNSNHKRTGLAVLAAVIIIGAVSIYFYLGYKSTHITTDDAFIDGDIHTIASKVPGTVMSVHVKSNQYVAKGDVLVELDPSDYRTRLDEASSAFHAEKSRIQEIDLRIEGAKKQLNEAVARADARKAFLELQQATFEQALKDRDRAAVLVKKEAMSRERYEKTETAYKVAEAQVKAASEDLKNMLAAVESHKVGVKQAEAAKATQTAVVGQRAASMATAGLNFGYVKILSPASGYVTKKSVELGNQVQPGQPLMAVVPLDGIYLMANFKETQLEKVRAGQKVEIKVDSYPGKKFKGSIESIMAGTGASFSLFPPENATGNFVKVVQRIPVKILFDKDTDKEHVLRLGMSVEPTVLIEK